MFHEDSRIKNYTFDFQKHEQVSLFTEGSDKHLAKAMSLLRQNQVTLIGKFPQIKPVSLFSTRI